MTRDEFIKLISDEITVSGSLPYDIPRKEYHRIINTALNWAYINYQYAVTTAHFVIELKYFKNEYFRKYRTLTLPDIIVSIYDLKEIRGHQRIGYIDRDFSLEKFIAYDVYSTMNAVGNFSDSLVMRVAFESYWDLSKAFFLERIAFQYNHNTNQLTIMGREPLNDVWIQTYIKIPEEKLFEDWTFQRYCTAQAKISLARLLGTIKYKLPGGVEINYDQIRQEGENELQSILEKIDQENTTDWFLIYH